MELSEYLAILRKHAVAIAVAGVLGFVAAYGYASTLPPRYTATASLYVAVPGSATVGERVQGASYAQNRVESYAELAATPFVIEPVIDQLDLQSSALSVARNLTVTSPLGTSVLEIRYTSGDPERAAAVANAIGAQLAAAVAQLEGPGEGGRPAVELTVVASADPPSFPSAPNTRLLAATGLVAGLGLAVLIFVARSALDTRIRSAKDVRRISDAAVVATVRRDRKAPADPIVFRSAPLGDRAEAYRRLRTNLRFLDAGRVRRTILVTSAIPQEGKTTTALNLAVAMAEGDSRILLIDADLRRPSAARYLGLESAAGLTSVLIGEVSEEDVVQPWGENLDVLAAGQIPPNPSELLDSHAMAALLGRLAERYDVIVVDTPPLIPVTDAAALSRVVDGVLLVVGCQTVHRSQLAEALAALDTVDARLLGLVLNQVAEKELGTTYVYVDKPERWPFRRGRAAGRARHGKLRAVSSGLESPLAAERLLGEAQTDPVGHDAPTSGLPGPGEAQANEPADAPAGVTETRSEAWEPTESSASDEPGAAVAEATAEEERSTPPRLPTQDGRGGDARTDDREADGSADESTPVDSAQSRGALVDGSSDEQVQESVEDVGQPAGSRGR